MITDWKPIPTSPERMRTSGSFTGATIISWLKVGLGGGPPNVPDERAITVPCCGFPLTEKVNESAVLRLGIARTPTSRSRK
jgi:hypothetical protein